MTHVRDEVAADTLDPARLRDVARERDRADDLAVAAQRERAQLQHLAGRAVELKLPFRAVSRQRLLHQLRDRFFGEDLPGARTRKAAGHRVAHHFAPDAVDHDDRVARLVERGEQPVLHRLRLHHPIVRLAPDFGDRVDEREVVGNVDRAPDPAQLAPGVDELAGNEHNDDPPDQTDDDEQRRHDRSRAGRIIRIDR